MLLADFMGEPDFVAMRLLVGTLAAMPVPCGDRQGDSRSHLRSRRA